MIKNIFKRLKYRPTDFRRWFIRRERIDSLVRKLAEAFELGFHKEHDILGKDITISHASIKAIVEEMENEPVVEPEFICSACHRGEIKVVKVPGYDAAAFVSGIRQVRDVVLCNPGHIRGLVQRGIPFALARRLSRDVAVYRLADPYVSRPVPDLPPFKDSMFMPEPDGNTDERLSRDRKYLRTNE